MPSDCSDCRCANSPLPPSTTVIPELQNSADPVFVLPNNAFVRVTRRAGDRMLHLRALFLGHLVRDSSARCCR